MRVDAKWSSHDGSRHSQSVSSGATLESRRSSSRSRVLLFQLINDCLILAELREKKSSIYIYKQIKNKSDPVREPLNLITEKSTKLFLFKHPFVVFEYLGLLVLMCVYQPVG